MPKGYQVRWNATQPIARLATRAQVIAYDNTYTGLADSTEEGERLAAVVGNKHIIFMKNHGVVVTGDSVAQAYRRLYKLERVCSNQILAMGTGQPLVVLSDEVVARVLAPNPPPSARRARAPVF